jgi:predicted dehydrogenase
MIRMVQLGVEHPHAAAYRQTLALFPERIEVVGFLARSGDTSTVIGEQFAGVPVFHSLDELLNGVEFDAAQVMVRTNEMGPAMTTLANEGKHLWAEKPVAISAEALLPVRDAVNKKGLAFTSGFQSRFYPTTRYAQSLVREGLLGPLTFSHMTTTTTTIKLREPDGPLGYLFEPPVSGGGIFQWLGCHMVDLLLAIAGEVPIEATAVTARVGEITTPVEDIASVALRFASGWVASLNYAYLLPTKEPSPFANDEPEPALYGQQGWVRWNQARDEAKAYSTDARWQASPWRYERFRQPATGGYGAAAYLAMQNFLDTIAGTAEPEYTVDQAINVLRVIEAAYASASSRTTVAV